MPLAHFISFTYYGHWLRGRAPGWIDGHQRNAHGDPIPGPEEVVVDARGFIYISDKNYGLTILRYTGPVKN